MEKKPSITPLDYKSAGVDITAGNELVNRIKPLVKTTAQPGLLGGIGGFAGLFELDIKNYENPILVSGTDGVGTKLQLSIELQKYDTIGIDLVAMCVNDILVTGAKPLFFLDYFATGALKVDAGVEIISGIAEGCRQAKTVLIGGETAEMPGLYQGDDYDLAGFCVGIVDKKHLITQDKVQVGDALLALPSSGVHSNGYSLVRKILATREISLQQPFGEETLGEALLRPTLIYAQAIMALGQEVPLHGLSHITGGGLLENVPRMLPKGTEAFIDTSTWTWPALFTFLQKEGNVALTEMYRTFNCGVGMVIALPQEHVKKAQDILKKESLPSWVIGEVRASSEDSPHVVMSGLHE